MEVIISTAIIVAFLPFAGRMLVNNELWASYSKHKLQAAYAAKQIIETQRQQAVLYGTITSPVVLDTFGQYNNPSDFFLGSSIITVSPAVYSDAPGSPNPNIAHMIIKITWPEKILNTQVPMTETYAADIIINDTILN